MRPAVFLINLDAATDRLAFMREQASRAGIIFERISATLGAAVGDRWRDQFLLTDGRVASKLNPGEVGCYASHLMTSSIVVERDLAMAVVLEDDVELPPDFGQFLDDVTGALPATWDIIKLNNNPSRAVYSVGRVGSRHLVHFYRQPPMTGGYLISNAGARKLLVPRARTMPIDMEMRQPWHTGLDMLGVCPPPVRQLQSMGSYIYESGGGKRMRGKHFRDPRRTLVYALMKMGVLPTLACRLVEFRQMLALGTPSPPATARGAWIPKQK